MKKFIISSIILLIIGAFTVFDWHFPKISSENRPPTKYDLLYENIAVNPSRLNYDRSEFCGYISPVVYLTAAWGGSGSKVSLLQSDCFEKLALNQLNPAYCEKVKPINTWLLNGSNVNPDACRTQISESSGNLQTLGTFLSANYMREILQEMGFNYGTDSDYQKNLSLGGEELALLEYWSKVEDTNEFITRARQLPH